MNFTELVRLAMTIGAEISITPIGDGKANLIVYLREAPSQIEYNDPTSGYRRGEVLSQEGMSRFPDVDVALEALEYSVMKVAKAARPLPTPIKETAQA